MIENFTASVKPSCDCFADSHYGANLGASIFLRPSESRNNKNILIS
jgi:hypothetical protein